MKGAPYSNTKFFARFCTTNISAEHKRDSFVGVVPLSSRSCLNSSVSIMPNHTAFCESVDSITYYENNKGNEQKITLLIPHCYFVTNAYKYA